jgi:hypothetical protein
MAQSRRKKTVRNPEPGETAVAGLDTVASDRRGDWTGQSVTSPVETIDTNQQKPAYEHKNNYGLREKAKNISINSTTACT